MFDTGSFGEEKKNIHFTKYVSSKEICGYLRNKSTNKY